MATTVWPMLNWIIRYQPIAQLLEEQHATRVLDVGSGWHGLSLYWRHAVVQTDLAFLGDDPWPKRLGTAHFVAASAERLPFHDDAFDVSISVDMMEHLPTELRGPFIDELTRVSRNGVIVGYPVGRPAYRVDRTLNWLFRLTPRLKVPDWLQEHLDQESYPQQDLLQMCLPETWTITRSIPNENAYMAAVRAYAELLPGLRGLCDRLEGVVRQRGLPALLDRGTTYRTLYIATPISR